MNRILLPITLGLIALFVVSGCGGPEREIRSRLSAAERDLFDRGQRLSTPCWSCHDLYGEQNKVGPYLAGLNGRRAGSANFPGYSASMKRSGVVWDERSLRSYLLNPSAFIPGTTMVASGPGNPVDSSALVFYLMHVTKATEAVAGSR
jgi:cytochrome c